MARPVGRAKLELGETGESILNEEVISPAQPSTTPGHRSTG